MDVRAQPKRLTHPWVAAGKGKIRFGIAGGPQAASHGFLDFVRLVEMLGFDSYWHGDHPG